MLYLWAVFLALTLEKLNSSFFSQQNELIFLLKCSLKILESSTMLQLLETGYTPPSISPLLTVPLQKAAVNVGFLKLSANSKCFYLRVGEGAPCWLEIGRIEELKARWPSSHGIHPSFLLVTLAHIAPRCHCHRAWPRRLWLVTTMYSYFSVPSLIGEKWSEQRLPLPRVVVPYTKWSTDKVPAQSKGCSLPL